MLAWYTVDGIFTRKSSSSRPRHLTNDDLSNHYTRGVSYKEIFPNKELGTNDNTTLPVLNLAFYPNERGPYNLDAENVNSDGTLGNPEKRWGGVMRKIEPSDLESANYEYIEFWLLDPYLEDETAEGGDLYFNLGEISEDILKDERKFFENGMPVDGDMSKVDTTVWGKVPRTQSTGYAFDAQNRELQDVGLNGLSTEEEQIFPTYADYLNKLRAKLSGETISKMMDDPFLLLTILPGIIITISVGMITMLRSWISYLAINDITVQRETHKNPIKDMLQPERVHQMWKISMAIIR